MQGGDNMTEREAFSQPAMARTLANTLDAPLLYLSSRQTGLEDLVAEAFLEPMQQQAWKPHQFILRHRIEKAQYLLRATNAPLAYVALESGFAGQSHLTRTFKRRLGITPKAYRQKQGNSARFCNG
jgi:AraC-like DNA-binding protein